MNETLTIVNNQTNKNNFTKQILIFSYKLLSQSQQITTKIINIGHDKNFLLILKL
jgi:hypothetical protein